MASEQVDGAPTLRLESVFAGYSGNEVLHGVSVDAHAGKVALILGPNGAGKSTMLAVGAGMVKPRSGRVLLHGIDVSNAPVHLRARKGIALVPEGRRIFKRQSVSDNLLLGTVASSGDRQWRDQAFAWVWELFPVLERKQRKLAATLSGGEQQMLAIAQGVMSNPKVLLLDEPSAGLSPLLAKQVLSRVELLKERGIAVVIVEQIVSALDIADYVYVVRNGEVVHGGPASEMRAEDLGSQYLSSAPLVDRA